MKQITKLVSFFVIVILLKYAKHNQNEKNWFHAFKEPPFVSQL